MAYCAYCKEDEVLTREHIIPSFIYKYLNENGGHAGWNERAGKIIGGEGKIKDTCAKCNNEILGELDAHGQNMLQNSGVYTLNFLNESMILHYDYDLLLRWFLKITFNSARATRSTPSIFEKNIPYILGKQKTNKDVFILSAIHKPAQLNAEEMDKYKDELPFDKNGNSNPFFFRIVAIPNFDNDFTVKGLVIGSIMFLIVMFNQGIEQGFKKSKIRKLLKLYPGMKIIERKSKVTIIKQFNLTYLDTQKDQASRLQRLGVM